MVVGCWFGFWGLGCNTQIRLLVCEWGVVVFGFCCWCDFCFVVGQGKRGKTPRAAGVAVGGVLFFFSEKAILLLRLGVSGLVLVGKMGPVTLAL